MKRIERPRTDPELSIRMPQYAPRKLPGPVPEVLIDALPTMCLKINIDWLRHVIGVLDALDQPDAWQGDSEVREFARSEVRRLLANIYECSEVADNMGCVIGEIKSYIGDEAPGGTLDCDGTWYFSGDYPDLFAALPSSMKAGGAPEDFFFEGSPAGDWFQTPNLAGRSLLGAGTGWLESALGGLPGSDPDLMRGFAGDDSGVYPLAASAGEEEHTLSFAELPALAARRQTSAFVMVQDAAGEGTTRGGTDNRAAQAAGGQPHNNMPPYFVVNFCIVATCTQGEPVMTTYRLRQNPDDDCLLEQSLNNGTTWSLAFDYSKCRSISDLLDIQQQIAELQAGINHLIEIYDGTPESINPIVDYGDENDVHRDDALCFAIWLFVYGVAKSASEAKGKAYDDIFNLGASLSTVLAGFNVFALAAGAAGMTIMGPVAIMATAFLAWDLANANFIFDLLNDTGLIDVNGELDLGAVDEVSCCMFGNLAGSDITYASFTNALDGCDFSSYEPADTLSLLVAGILSDLPGYVSFINLFGQIIPTAIAGFELPCPCPAFAGCFVFNFESESMPGETSLTPNAVFIANTGVRGNGATDNAGVLWTSPIGQVEVTKIRAIVQIGPSSLQSVIFTAFNSESGTPIYDQDGHSSGRRVITWEGSQLADQIRVVNQPLSSGALPAGNYIYEIEICYEVD